MPSYTSFKTSFSTATLWKESIRQASNACPVLYVFIGNNVPYANESSPDSIVETTASEKKVWDNIFAAKRVVGNNIELVAPRINWTSNTKYRQYDDIVSPITLLTANTQQNLKPMYVITSERNVYKCISNNSSANSTVEPTGNYNTSNGNIATADGYIWKYMYNIKPSNQFLTDSWIPAPISTEYFDYDLKTAGIVDGELTSIIVTNNGSNYREASNIKVNAFGTGQSTIKITNTALAIEIFSCPLANLANMSLSGVGIQSGTYVSAISNTTGEITLSTETIASGGNTSNVALATRVYIDGDGTGVLANAILSTSNINATAANANVSKITVSTIGTDYSFANVFIYGTGSGASARAIIPPKFGHGYNPAEEICANNVMIVMRMGELDSTEGGSISVATSFRQFGLLKNPYKYGQTTAITPSQANLVISQATSLSLVAGSNYTLNEYVYQGTLSNPTAYGFVYSQSSNLLKLTKVKGTFRTGVVITGITSGTSRTVIGITNPAFQPYSGDILYAENATKTERADGQAENIKMTISF